MSERTRRASDAVDAHATYMEQCRPGTAKAFVEGVLLDPAGDPSDVRYGHDDFLYGKGNTFQGWVGEEAAKAMTFTATADLFGEMLLTMEMMDEEGLSFLPLHEHHLPATNGFFLFPYGIKNPTHTDHGQEITTVRGDKFVVDHGCGDEHWVDGFMWFVHDRVSRDGHAGSPVRGATFILLTRWRDNAEHRPFRPLQGRMTPPELVGSDLTGWAFDTDERDEWVDPEFLVAEQLANRVNVVEVDKLRDELAANRWWVRSLIWSVLRWTTEEIWLDERPDRAAARRLKRARPVLHEQQPEDGKVVIVDLRPERREAIEKSEASGEPPWWRTRWRVRGHWARRRTAIRDEQGVAVGPVRGPEAVEGVTYRYKRVFIEPFVKGPDNAPLVLRDPVGVVTR